MDKLPINPHNFNDLDWLLRQVRKVHRSNPKRTQQIAAILKRHIHEIELQLSGEKPERNPDYVRPAKRSSDAIDAPES